MDGDSALLPPLKTQKLPIDFLGGTVLLTLYPGGQWRGVNALARSLAHFIGAEAGVTTASDVRGLFSPEEIASRLNAKLEGNRETLLGILNRLIKAEKLDFLKSVFAKH